MKDVFMKSELQMHISNKMYRPCKFLLVFILHFQVTAAVVSRLCNKYEGWVMEKTLIVYFLEAIYS